MELPELIDALSDPRAYPGSVNNVEVKQTHISVVFLAGERVYKIKKPVQLGFVDFSTLEKRRHFCQEEVRLNARLAAEIYQGVVPVVWQGDQVRIDAAGEPIEWAVAMRRLPDDATLESHLQRGLVSRGQIEDLAGTIAGFHAVAERNERIASFGRIEVVAANARGNYEQSRAQIGQTISFTVFQRLQALTDAALIRHEHLIESRAARGVPCDTHGDLRIDHVYFVHDIHGATRTLIIDCIEFNEAFRFSDPVADVAFLVMDLKFAGESALADALADAYFTAAGDAEGRHLLNFYVTYRAAVRGKVEGLKQAEPEVPAEDREVARERARGYWLLALGELESPERRPGLVLTCGLPGSGKSTLAADLAQHANFELIRSDVVRKQLAEKELTKSSQQSFGTGIYTSEWNERTYAECLNRAEASLFEGRRVLVDASFREEARRREFVEAAKRWKVPVAILQCEASEDVIYARLAQRKNDASDADWAIYLDAKRNWEAPGPVSRSCMHVVDSAGTRDETLAQSLRCLSNCGLVS